MIRVRRYTHVGIDQCAACHKFLAGEPANVITVRTSLTLELCDDCTGTIVDKLIIQIDNGGCGECGEGKCTCRKRRSRKHKHQVQVAA